MAAPPDAGTIVSCSCGDAFLRLPAAPKVNGVWRKVDAGQTGRCSWITLLAGHLGHTMTIAHLPAPPVGPSGSSPASDGDQ
jgi:hypothetical protein